MSHTCHAEGCRVVVKPALLMCRKHWFMVSKALRDKIWELYRPGQERDKRPTVEYLEAAQACVEEVAKAEGRR